MAPDGSITRWIGLLQAGDPAAVQQLWERYFRRLVGLARKKLAGSPRRAADEEDVALSAFDTFCRRAEQGRFPQLSDRDSLWRLLVVITSRKASHQVHYDQRQKRVPPRPAQAVSQANQPDLDQIISREPRPDDVVVMAEEYQRLLQGLGNPELKSIAQWRMEGYTVEEIAGKLGYAPRSIKRKLRLIRTAWEKEVTP